MGHIQNPDYRSYWSKSLLFGTFGFSRLLSLDHFEQIRTNLHFVDEETITDIFDVLYKINLLIQHFIKVSQNLYTPQQRLTIDETMIKYKGRSKIKVYMPLKPIKYGFKAYVLAEANSG